MANANDSSDQIDFTRFYRPKQYSFSTNIFDLQTGPLKRNINWNWIKYDDRLKAFWLVHVFICICVSFSDLFSRYIDKCIDRYRISVDLIYIYIYLLKHRLWFISWVTEFFMRIRRVITSSLPSIYDSFFLVSVHRVQIRAVCLFCLWEPYGDRSSCALSSTNYHKIYEKLMKTMRFI